MRPALPEGSFRCLLVPNAVGLQSPKPTLALDVSRDEIRLGDAGGNEQGASAWRAQVTATPAVHRLGNNDAGIPMPVLVVRAPGWQPLAIGSPGARSWRGEVAQEAAGYVVSDADWPALVDIFGLGSQLTSHRSRTASGRRLGRGRQRVGFGGWFMRIVLACLGVLFLYMAVDYMHWYQAGTPTTVTVTHCTSGRGAYCEGKWTVNGWSQSGQIMNSKIFGAYPVGSSLDVHIWKGTAYTSTAAYFPLGVGVLMTGGAVFSFIGSFRRNR